MPLDRRFSAAGLLYYYFDSFNLGLAPLGESARFTTFFNVKE